jgi:hypothetical protein
MWKNDEQVGKKGIFIKKNGDLGKSVDLTTEKW